MSEPVYSNTTEGMWNRIPDHFRRMDAQNNWTMKKYLNLMGSQLQQVDSVIDRVDYDSVANGGELNSTSDLANPQTADTTWLPWLGQLFGVHVKGKGTERDRNVVIEAASGYNAGTAAAIEAAAKEDLVGTKFAKVYKNMTTSGVGSFWDLLLVTIESETLKNLYPKLKAIVSDIISWNTTQPTQLIATNRVPNPMPVNTTGMGAASGTMSVVSAPWDPNRTAIRVTSSSSNVNLHPNPTFDVDLTNINEVDANDIVTLTRDTSVTRTGGGSAKIAYSGGGSGQTGGFNFTVSGLTIGLTYYVSAWFYVPAGSQAVVPVVVTPSSTTSTTTTPSTDQWYQRTINFQATATSHTWTIRNFGTTSAGQSFYVDDMEVIRVPSPTHVFSSTSIDSYLAGDTITVRAKVKASNPNRGYYISIHQRSPNVYLVIPNTSIAGPGHVMGNTNTNWKELVLTGTLPSNVAAGQLDIAVLSVTLGGTFGYASIESGETITAGDYSIQKDTNEPFFDGNTEDTIDYLYAFTGTVNDSTSTKTLTPAVSKQIVDVAADKLLYGDHALAISSQSEIDNPFLMTVESTAKAGPVDATDWYQTMLNLHTGSGESHAGTLGIKFYDNADIVTGTFSTPITITGEPTQFYFGATAPVNSTKLSTFFTVTAMDRDETIYVAQLGSRHETSLQWIPESADPVKSVIEKGAKPAGFKLHYGGATTSWDDVLAANPTWQDWENAGSWSAIEETSN